MSIKEVLTNDEHFSQEGFIILIKGTSRVPQYFSIPVYYYVIIHYED